MIARLWWKEARQVWPAWVFLAGFGLLEMGLAQWFASPAPPGVFAGHAAVLTFLYMFLIGAAVFAGEREHRTLELLDALPVERWRVWVAKATFAAASTAALGLILLLPSVVLESPPPDSGRALICYFLLCGFGWSLFWSSLSSNALVAATLAICSLGATYVQLNPKGTLWNNGLTVQNWVFAVGLIAASAAILQFGGPPRTSWLGTWRRARPAPLETSDTDIIHGRFGAAWPASVLRLLWQALREVWPVWWPLMAIGIALWGTLAWTQAEVDPSAWALGALLVGVVLGANAFNAENRRGTQRFLAAHGARPGVVWLVKLAVSLAAAPPAWFVWLALSYRGTGKWTGAPEGWSSLQFHIILIGFFLGTAFAAGVLCGMVFRRGITAALAPLILWLAASLPPFAMLAAKLLWPSHLIWVPVAILAVTWAWSGDWLLDRPGFGRWARLGMYSAAVFAVLFSAYAADRVWSVPTIPEAEQARIFQFDRIAAPAPPERNAASLYREVAAAGLDDPTIDSMKSNIWGVPHNDWDESAPEVLDWLSRNAASLETLRKAAAMPVCRFQDLRTRTVFTEETEKPDLRFFDLALAVSARVRFAQGDSRGSWEDIETLLRMGRQFSGLNPESVRRHGYEAERIGLSLAMRWANAPRLTAELLKTARDAHRALPPLPSLVDQARADALLAQNTAELSRDDLFKGMTALMSRPPEAIDKLSFGVMTTPWEMARLHRVGALLSAARIQSLERRPQRPAPISPYIDIDYRPRQIDRVPPADDLSNTLVIWNGQRATVVSPNDLLRLNATTPMASLEPAGRRTPPKTLSWGDDNGYNRPALDVILSLRLWQAEHGGRLPESLDELVKADPEVLASLPDPFAQGEPPPRFGYVRSKGQTLFISESIRPNSLARRGEKTPTNGYMLLYSVGPDGRDDQAGDVHNYRDGGDIIFPIKDNVPPPE